MPDKTTDTLVILAVPTDGPERQPGRVVAIEPAPDRARALARADPAVTVIEAALAGAPGPAPLIRYNLPGLRAFRPPLPALRALFPGLRETGRDEVERLDVPGLLERTGPWPERVVLHLDAPGEEADILAALDDRGLLGRIHALVLHCGAEPLFEGAESADALSARLAAAGLRETGRDAADPDRPVLRFARDPAVDRLQAARAEAEAEIRALRAAAEAEARAAREALAASEQRIQATEAEADGLRARAAEAETAARTAREDLALALRMQDLLQGDLDDLRARHREVEAVRARQAALLAELAPRLRQAARELGLAVPAPAEESANGAAATEIAPAEAAEPTEATDDAPRLTGARRKSGKKKRGRARREAAG